MEEKQKESFDKSHRIVDFPKGSDVMTKLPTRAGKLSPAYKGPCTVLRKTSGSTYVLLDETGVLMDHNYPPSDLNLISHDEVISAAS